MCAVEGCERCCCYTNELRDGVEMNKKTPGDKKGLAFIERIRCIIKWFVSWKYILNVEVADLVFVCFHSHVSLWTTEFEARERSDKLGLS